MADFFKSAFNMFGNQPASSSNTPANNATTPTSQPGQSSGFASSISSSFTSRGNNDFVGQIIAIGNMKLRVTKMLAEGGFAIVYVVQDLGTGAEYALKRIFSADDATSEAIKEEISYLKKLKDHPNIIQFISAACENVENSKSKEFLILTELCKDPIIDHLRAGLSLPTNGAFNFDQVLNIFYQICRSVQYLHNQEPAIVHRDLKLENFLVSAHNSIKLCDFGSATTTVYQPDNSWSVNKRNLIEDEIARQTTPMYRAPEMLDLYSNYRIDSQADIWALGCVLYLLCFNKHPFEDGAKLRIINGKYQIPANDKDFNEFHDLLRCMLNTDPSQRPNVNEVLFHLENIAKTRSVELSESLSFLKRTEQLIHQNFGINATSNNQPPSQSNPSEESQANSSNWMGGGASSFFKSSSLFKSIKDASSKVMDTVQSSINRTDLDMSYITSRLIVMSCPTEGIEAAAFGNNIDLVKEAIESKHGKNYRIYNLSQKIYRKEKLSQVIDLGAQLNPTRAPPAYLMLKLSANIAKFLGDNAKNVCIIHCGDGRVLSAIGVCTFLLYCGVLKNPDSCLNLFHVKRGGAALTLTPSQIRILRDTQQLVQSYRIGSPLALASNDCILTGITLTGVPLFNKLRNGCTPFVEIYQRDKKIYTNFQSYDQLKKFTSRDGQITIPINCHKFYGDIMIIVYHAKSLLGTEKITTNRIFQLQFHTAFAMFELTPNSQLRYSKNELDGLDSPDKYPNGFGAILSLTYKNIESPLGADEPWNNKSEFESQLSRAQPHLVFNSPDEMNHTIHTFESGKPYSDDKPARPPPVSSQQLRVPEGYHDGDQSSSASSRSGSPMPQHPSSLPLFEQEADLLNLGGDEQNNRLSGSENYNRSESRNAQPSEKVTSEMASSFGMLLDLDDTGSSMDAGATAAASRNSTASNILKDEFSIFDTNVSNSGSSSNVTSNRASDNLLGFDFSAPTPTVPAPNNFNSKPSPNMTFDPFGGPLFTSNTSNQPINPTLFSSQKNSSSASNLQQPGNNNNNKPKDPFGDLFSSNFSSSSSSVNSSSQNNLNQSRPAGAPAATGSTTGSPFNHSQSTYPTTTHTPTPPLNTQSSFQPPNYNIHSTQANRPAGNTSTNTTSTTKSAASAFGDLLGDFTSNTAASKANRPIKELIRERDAKEIDPDKLKIMDWTEGKKNNIRALLCSLNQIIWPDSKWNQVGMHQLVGPTDVRKVYHKALLAVHPDKLGKDDPNYNLANLIQIELNDAWAHFQKENQQQNS